MPFLSPGFVDFNDLSKVWQPDQPHVAVRWLRATGSRSVPLPFKAARPPGAGQCSSVKGPARLLRRARDRAERAEHAAVAVLGAQPRTAFPTVIKKSAGIDRHVFALREAAMRTGDHGMKNGVSHDF
jgi:hypothetical protein